MCDSADDFSFSGLHLPGNTSNPVGSRVTPVTVVQLLALNSQNPGMITIANAVFGSKPNIASDILVKAFEVDKNIVDPLQAKF
ncbi:germin 2-1 [Olea europaea subsp. europaea]|uniref:Germin 2-1 n=1 Tax=Olea europaea subsp. europaea TaxID=158383 RepID=A0A8S0VE59_OLEEU|nr:germin 2-1 [Olea europaea subsp. europaea]